MNRFLSILLSLCAISISAQAQFYNPGDIIEIDGHKAIVFETDDTGTHGKAMYVKAYRGVDDPWCNSGKHSKRLPDLTNREDGQFNTLQVLNYAHKNDALASFPVFTWCEKLGKNWYIPSVNELEAFINFWLGNNIVLEWDDDVENEIEDNNIFYKTINNKLLDAGGSAFINGVYTSTVDKGGKVYVFQFDRKKNSWKFKLKSKTGLGQDCVGRAFVKF
ncbi:MAG: hypothetical protein J6B44_09400 [Muribaculaceae bacterium]|nr:hypothetical protein [Muribaculaceae bacterium]